METYEKIFIQRIGDTPLTFQILKGAESFKVINEYKKSLPTTRTGGRGCAISYEKKKEFVEYVDTGIKSNDGYRLFIACKKETL